MLENSRIVCVSFLYFNLFQMKIFTFLLAMLSCSLAYSQITFKAYVKNGETNEILIGATAQLVNTSKGSVTNEKGFLEIKNIPGGKHQILFSYLGFESKIEEFIFPIVDTLQIFLKENDDDLIEILVQSTRTNRSLNNSPTRIETIDDEEIDEKSNMKPANVSMVLHESTGLQVQQTSATSGNASIRVQGLDGRYTQLLKDGYPNFGNFASGLSILEIPPLDLKQVEVIKGPASTLYGGGAIAGVVNFISKTPKENGEYNFILNQSNIKQTNLGVYASQRKGKFGYSVLGSVNFQKSYDVDKDFFSEVPKSNNFTINPRLFIYPTKNSSLIIGNSFTKSNMKGGDMRVIDGFTDANHVYFEQNKTLRNTSTIEFENKIKSKNSLKIKQSLSVFDREINIPGYRFAGLNTNLFTDASYLWSAKKQTFIAGLNLMYDNFSQKNTNVLNARSFTKGAYVQQTWDINDNIKLENGLRLDHVKYSNTDFSKSQTFLLPRISALIKINSHWSGRFGGGLGYKVPTIFTEQTETMQYQNLTPLIDVVAERSIGGTFDINYKGKFFDDLLISIDQLFFMSSINKPLVLSKLNDNYYFLNNNKNVISKGFETNLKFIYKDCLKLFLGFTFTDAKANYLQGNQFLPLVPKNKLNAALIYEKENNFKLGLEGYFTDNQYLYNGTKTPSFWEFGFMAEKTIFDKFSFFINFENFTDTRQSNYKRVVNGSNTNPSFDDIWTHTEGFTFNGGIKIKLSK
jgi:outer membrane receptor for ferrienterochelin and colicins